MGLPMTIITTQNHFMGPFMTENTFELCMLAGIAAQLRKLLLMTTAT